MRLIDADRFLEQLEDQYMEHDLTRKDCIELEDRIMQQPTVEIPKPNGRILYQSGYQQGLKDEQQRWIPVDERLPEVPMCSAVEMDGVTHYISDPVLVTTADGEIAIATMEMPEDGPHGWDVDGILVEVIAWMPLPPVYEGEDE